MRARSSTAHSMAPASSASCSGVLPSLLSACTSAPCIKYWCVCTIAETNQEREKWSRDDKESHKVYKSSSYTPSLENMQRELGKGRKGNYILFSPRISHISLVTKKETLRTPFATAARGTGADCWSTRRAAVWSPRYWRRSQVVPSAAAALWKMCNQAGNRI